MKQADHFKLKEIEGHNRKLIAEEMQKQLKHRIDKID